MLRSILVRCHYKRISCDAAWDFLLIAILKKKNKKTIIFFFGWALP